MTSVVVRPPLGILISGPPASGKTTVAKELDRRLAIPCFGKDQLKRGPDVGRGTSDGGSDSGARLTTTDCMFSALLGAIKLARFACKRQIDARQNRKCVKSPNTNTVECTLE